ncbi:class I SAM-dependent methyltransferase [Nocardioides limicola]|uniref:class I SAM-dependent methyltransferase n=1 Tax=Nocardioides limicola TaxID=2803368 RepID=UPI0027DB62EA|nr:class I SAM-dependent methyltransferase [Nocardioides sp. DJM-14]
MSEVSFGPLRVQYDDRVLAPREWTRQQSLWAAELLPELPPGPVLELCAGVGHIGLLTAVVCPRPTVMVDVSPHACRHAVANVGRAGLSASIEVRCSRAEEALAAGERFALAIVDPPWVRHDRVSAYPDDPRTAIDGGSDGLAVARMCLVLLTEHLLPKGAVLLQLGSLPQAAQLSEWLERTHGMVLVVHEVRCFPGRGVLVLLRRDRSSPPTNST